MGSGGVKEVGEEIRVPLLAADGPNRFKEIEPASKTLQLF